MSAATTAAAEGVLAAAMKHGHTTPAELAAAEDSAGILFDPHTVEGIARAARAQLLDQLRAAARDIWTPADLQALIDELAKQTPAELTVYRAEYSSGLPLCTYTTAKAARAHCEAYVRREHPAGDRLVMNWLPDDEDEPTLWELLTRLDDAPAENDTGYCVALVDVAAAYNSEADE